MKFINVGFSNLVSAERIVVLAAPDSAPLKRLIQDSREEGRAIDCTCGKKTKSVIVTDSDHVILSALSPETLASRIDASPDGTEEENGEENA
ncbi:MAG: DUF370 domain-containing protein [Eubacteriales bacterium]